MDRKQEEASNVQAYRIHRSRRIVSPWLALMVVLSVGACTDAFYGGFNHKGDDQGRAALTGRAVTPGGEPAHGVLVFHRAGDTTLQTSTDANGRFAFSAAPVGNGIVVLNDSYGRGALVDVALFADGNNDVGTITIVSLEDYADIVDVPDVAFEQRLTRGAGDFAVHYFTSDGERALAARPVGDARWDLVWIETATGRESVIRDAELMWSPQWAGGAPYLFLLDDQFVGFTSDLDADDSDATFTIVDADGVEVFAARAESQSPPFVVTLERGLAIVEYESHDGHTTLFPTIIEDGEVTRGPATTLEERTVNMLGAGVEAMMMIAHPVCPETPCPDSDLLRLPFATLAPELVGPHPRSIWAATNSPTQAVRYQIVEDPFDDGPIVIEALDFDTGSRNVVATIDAGAERSVSLSIIPSGERLLVWDYGYADAPHQLWEVDVPAGRSQQLATEFLIDGEEVTFCDGRYCNARYRTDGSLELTTAVYRDEALRNHGLAVVRLADGEIVDRRMVPTPYPDLVRLIEPYPGGEELALMYADDSQTTQLFELRDDGPRQRTFIDAHHGAPVLSDDGRAFYFTRDPISGQTQLFVLDLAALPE